MASRTNVVSSPGDRIGMLIVLIVTLAAGLTALIIGSTRAITTALGAGEVTLTLPTSYEVPYESATESAPAIVMAGFDTATLTVSGLSDGTRALLAAGEGLGAIMAAIVCGAIAYFLLQLLRGRPFHRSLFGAAITSGCALTIGSLLSQALTGFGQMQAAAELNSLAPGVFDAALTVDLLPVGIGLVVIALAYVFRVGARLQRDTEGLV